jgi:hypothetical protein
MPIFRIIVGAAMLFILAACSPAAEVSPTPTPQFTRVSEAALAAGTPIPAPTGQVVLRVTGAISASNVEGEMAVEFDMETLESLGLVEYETYDLVGTNGAFVFRGVLLGEIAEFVGVSDEATQVFIRALDDYSISIPLTDFAAYPVLLATWRDGERMAVEDFGPTRVIYPDNAPRENDEFWIFSVATLNFE